MAEFTKLRAPIQGHVLTPSREREWGSRGGYETDVVQIDEGETSVLTVWSERSLVDKVDGAPVAVHWVITIEQRSWQGRTFVAVNYVGPAELRSARSA